MNITDDFSDMKFGVGPTGFDVVGDYDATRERLVSKGMIMQSGQPPLAQQGLRTTKRVYLIGSLRNAEVQVLAMQLRAIGLEVFDDWHAAGPEADDYWQKYETSRGRTYKEALAGAAAKNVFEFDKRNLLASDAVVLVMPAGKSGHLELGYCCGKGMPTCVFFPSTPDRYDVMYQFADYIAESEAELIEWAKKL